MKPDTVSTQRYRLYKKRKRTPFDRRPFYIRILHKPDGLWIQELRKGPIFSIEALVRSTIMFSYSLYHKSSANRIKHVVRKILESMEEENALSE